MPKYILLLLTFISFSAIASTPYSRGEFKHWIDEDSDCQDTREEILIRQGTQIRLSEDRCSVVSGNWRDSYSGFIINDSSILDIDHIVPLREAWDSGAYLWSPELRKKFANDLNNLLPTSFHLNRQKGSRDPSQWLPPRESFICDYISRWVKIKKSYNLQIDANELQTIEEIQKRCKYKL